MIQEIPFAWCPLGCFSQQNKLPNFYNHILSLYTSSFAKKKKPVDFDDELKIGDVRYDNMTIITIKV